MEQTNFSDNVSTHTTPSKAFSSSSNTIELHDPSTTPPPPKPMSERHNRMYALILTTTYGPHPIPPESSFRPGYNAVLGVKNDDEIMSAKPVSEMLRRSFQKLIAKKLLYRRTTMFNRQREIKQSNVEELADPIWDENNPWGDAEISVKSAVESLSEMGLWVECVELSWTEQLEVEKSKYRCFTPSLLKWSWSVMKDAKEFHELIQDTLDENKLEEGG